MHDFRSSLLTTVISGGRVLLSIPVSADPLEQIVAQDLTALFDGVESPREAGFARRGQTRYEPYSDSDIWQAIQKLRAKDSDKAISPQELKLPEWRLFSKPDATKNNRDLQLRSVDPPPGYQGWIEQVVLVEKLREVRAFVGFTRLEAAGEDSTTRLAPLRRGSAEWVPAAEVRGEGIFCGSLNRRLSAGSGSACKEISSSLQRIATGGNIYARVSTLDQ